MMYMLAISTHEIALYTHFIALFIVQVAKRCCAYECVNQFDGC